MAEYTLYCFAQSGNTYKPAELPFEPAPTKETNVALSLSEEAS